MIPAHEVVSQCHFEGLAEACAHHIGGIRDDTSCQISSPAHAGVEMTTKTIVKVTTHSHLSAFIRSFLS
jgi:hypothetical protein